MWYNKFHGCNYAEIVVFVTYEPIYYNLNCDIILNSTVTLQYFNIFSKASIEFFVYFNTTDIPKFVQLS